MVLRSTLLFLSRRRPLRRWVEQARVNSKGSKDGPLSSEERAELGRLRRENKRLTQERDFLKQAAAFFARETDRSSK